VDSAPIFSSRDSCDRVARLSSSRLGLPFTGARPSPVPSTWLPARGASPSPGACARVCAYPSRADLRRLARTRFRRRDLTLPPPLGALVLRISHYRSSVRQSGGLPGPSIRPDDDPRTIQRAPDRSPGFRSATFPEHFSDFACSEASILPKVRKAEQAKNAELCANILH
jgi:hypothetical protein